MAGAAFYGTLTNKLFIPTEPRIRKVLAGLKLMIISRNGHTFLSFYTRAMMQTISIFFRNFSPPLSAGCIQDLTKMN